jgi:hypothetical protein
MTSPEQAEQEAVLPNMAAPEWRAVRFALERATGWDRASASGSMHVATRPDPLREIRRLVTASEQAARAAGRAEAADEVLTLRRQVAELEAGTQYQPYTDRIAKLERVLRWAYDELSAWFDGPEWEGSKPPIPTQHSMDYISVLLSYPAEGPEAEKEIRNAGD